jgi:tetratricopeptide (TPR) repeat protein
LGAIAYYLGNCEQAEVYAQEALVLARQIGHRVQICRALANLGGLAIGQTDYTQAERYLQEGIELARQFGGHFDLPLMLMNLGKAIGQQGDYDRANVCFQESIELARRQGASWYMGAALIYWGDIHIKYHQLNAATDAFHKAITLNSGPERDLQLVAWAYYGLAQIAALHGDFSAARRLGIDSLMALDTIGDHKAEEVRLWLNSQPQKEDASI